MQNGGTSAVIYKGYLLTPCITSWLFCGHVCPRFSDQSEITLASLVSPCHGCCAPTCPDSRPKLRLLFQSLVGDNRNSHVVVCCAPARSKLRCCFGRWAWHIQPQWSFSWKAGTGVEHSWKCWFISLTEVIFSGYKVQCRYWPSLLWVHYLLGFG